MVVALAADGLAASELTSLAVVVRVVVLVVALVPETRSSGGAADTLSVDAVVVGVGEALARLAALGGAVARARGRAVALGVHVDAVVVAGLVRVVVADVAELLLDVLGGGLDLLRDGLRGSRSGTGEGGGLWFVSLEHRKGAVCGGPGDRVRESGVRSAVDLRAKLADTRSSCTGA